MNHKRKVTILGAGLVGSLLSIIMRKKGYEVTIYERRADMRKEEMSAGKSINLAMSNRGWKALEIAGLREEIEKIAIPMFGRGLHQIDGSYQFQQYGKNNEAIYSVSRGELNQKLMTLAEEEGAIIHFNHKCIGVDITNNTIEIEGENGDNQVINCDLLFGADGAFSALRQSMQNQDRSNFSQYFVEAGYKELFMPALPNGEWALEKNALHIWPRGKFMLIALANGDGSFTCTLFFPFEGNPSFDTVQNDEEINTFFNTYFADAVPLMPTLLEDYKRNPTSSLITVKISPWVNGDKSALIGDAAHAIVPFYGQGMNAGFEDCTVLFELINKYEEDWHTILKQYELKRKPNGDAVADLALQNFIEMRDKVADATFLERKKIEKDLGLRFPNSFNSVYEMVSFTHTPYAYALGSGKAQDILLEKIMHEGDYFSLTENQEFREKLNLWVDEYAQSIQNLSIYL